MGPAAITSGDTPLTDDGRKQFRRLATGSGPAIPTPLPLALKPETYQEWGPEQWEQALWPWKRTVRLLLGWVLRFYFLRWVRRRKDLAAQHVRALFETLGGLWI